MSANSDAIHALYDHLENAVQTLPDPSEVATPRTRSAGLELVALLLGTARGIARHHHEDGAADGEDEEDFTHVEHQVEEQGEKTGEDSAPEVRISLNTFAV